MNDITPSIQSCPIRICRGEGMIMVNFESAKDSAVN